MDPPRLTSKSDYADPQQRLPENRSGPDPRHEKRFNAVFCDGHVMLATPQELGYVVNPDESMAGIDSRHIIDSSAAQAPTTTRRPFNNRARKLSMNQTTTPLGHKSKKYSLIVAGSAAAVLVLALVAWRSSIRWAAEPRSTNPRRCWPSSSRARQFDAMPYDKQRLYYKMLDDRGKEIDQAYSSNS